MDSEVFVAIVSGLSVAIPTIFTTLLSNAKNNALQDERIGNLQKQISDLSKHVDKQERYGLEIADLRARVGILEKGK